MTPHRSTSQDSAPPANPFVPGTRRPAAETPASTVLGHPPGLFVLFLVEMWERFSYYGMRALLILYLTAPVTGMLNPPPGRPPGYNPGRGWSDYTASTAYGWYTGLAYLLPIIGGLIADKLIGTHRSMVVGGVTIALGHLALAASGLGELAHSRTGTSVFIFGLALIVIGTGHFKPTVSVMVGQLYPPGDPRRDGAFTIFYMGINLGAFLCNFVCGTLAYRVGWHWGFGAAAVGMIAGLVLYLAARPRYLEGIGLPPPGRGRSAPFFVLGAVGISALFALVYHVGWIAAAWSAVEAFFARPTVQWAIPLGMLAVILIACTWFVAVNRPEDRGPVASIFIFMFFNAFFWIAFEQAGSSLNLFTDRYTDRTLTLFGTTFTIDTPLFQSINPLLIIVGAPAFAYMWGFLGRRGLNPSQPVKIALGLLFLAFGYMFMVWAARLAGTPGVRASMMFIVMTYFWHTVGELCLSPTGLSYVTKVAPVRFVSLLMGVWFISSFIANLGGGLIAAQVERVEKGELVLPWHVGPGQADFFFLFVVTSGAAGVAILTFSPLLKRLSRGRE